jgi:hypothetical protein
MSTDHEDAIAEAAMSMFFWKTTKGASDEQVAQEAADSRELLRRRVKETEPDVVREWERHCVAYVAMGALIRVSAGSFSEESLAVRSYDIAEAMMKERERRVKAELEAKNTRPRPGGGKAA